MRLHWLVRGAMLSFFEGFLLAIALNLYTAHPVWAYTVGILCLYVTYTDGRLRLSLPAQPRS